ncbi:MAG TPA: transglycosylase domain-containing protein, partial [Actinomycetales bacterium]|nr:transglycosylase domain-containing protein [Actinomycetales bacterium]
MSGSSHTSGGLEQVGRAVSLLAAFVAVSVVAGVLAAGLVMPAVGATGTLARNSVDFFDSLPEELEQQPLSQQSRILWADGSVMATFYFENRVLVPLSSVAPVMRQAIIAIEDSRFYEHGGVDPQGMSRALVNNFSGGDTQGASTLTQQWVKNVLLQQARAAEDTELEKSLLNEDYGRKLREAKLAISAEENLTKDEILERYLNIALFGDGQFGVQTAATHFFSKSAADLTLPEAALLAGMIQSPRRYDPLDNPEAALDRRDVVLARMLELGVIDQVQHDEAVALPLDAIINPQPINNGCQQAGAAAYFCTYVTRVLRNDATFGQDAATRERLLYRGGLTIQTTLRKDDQQAAWEEVTAAVPPTDPSGVGASIVSVEPGTGQITAMAQNRTYTPSPEPVPGGSAYNYNVDTAYGGTSGFQPGSTYKPFTLATWLASGKSLSARIPAPARPSYQIGDDFTASCADLVNGDEPYTPQNSEGGGGGTMTVLEATYNSVNTAYLEMSRQLDLCAIRDTAAKLGVHRADGNPLEVFPSSVIGANLISPLTMAAAYATFAESGTFCNPIAITKVTDATGADLPVPAADCAPVLDPEIANAVTYALTQTVERGTARRLTFDRPAAGKTGTTNNSVETWFVGFTPQLATAVWVGTPDGDEVSLNDLTINGDRRNVFGATIAAPTWQRYMTRALEGEPVAGFPEASERTLIGERVTVPSVAGQSAETAEAAIRDADLEAAISPNRRASDVPDGAVVTTDPGPGSRVPPGTTVTLVLS